MSSNISNAAMRRHNHGQQQINGIVRDCTGALPPINTIGVIVTDNGLWFWLASYVEWGGWAGEFHLFTNEFSWVD